MMKRMIMRFLTLTFLSLMSATVLADEVDKRLDAASDGVVSISNISGTIEVIGWSRNEVEVTGDLGKDVAELIFERDGNEIEITVRPPKDEDHDEGGYHHGSHSISSDLVINVPVKSSIEIVGVSTDINIQNILGEQHVQTVSGDIESEIRAADVEIQTVSGDVEVQGDDVAGHCQLGSVSGDVEAQNLAGNVVADTVSGDLTIVNSSFERVKMKTVNGDVIFESGLLDGGSFGLQTHNGDVDINFTDGISARFSIETFNGDINNCFGPEPVEVSEHMPGAELKFKEGKGEGRVTIHTFNGDLRLCKD
jgi:DUF4097 and DUF4098 domain-containing protein YvlB